MKAGIICAMKEELEPLLADLSGREDVTLGGHIFHTGKLDGKDTVLTESGIGKVHAGMTATLLITSLHADLIINTGSAGALGPAEDLPLGSVAVSTAVAYHDVDLTPFGYECGQFPGRPRIFAADEKLVKAASSCTELKCTAGLIVSGDQFICTPEAREKILQNFPDALVCEMEGAAVGHVCTECGVPFLVVRSVSDPADGTSPVKFEEFLPVASRNAAIMTRCILEKL